MSGSNFLTKKGGQIGSFIRKAELKFLDQKSTYLFTQLYQLHRESKKEKKRRMEKVKDRFKKKAETVIWLDRELTLTIYLFACLAFGNHKTNTLNGAKHAAWADFF